MPRDDPYPNFNFIVAITNLPGEDQVTGGFSDVSGLGNDIKYAEYRNGNEPENHVRKIPNVNTTDDVTLKRGVIGDARLFNWLVQTRRGEGPRQTVTITLLDEAREEVCRWILSGARPKKYVGPTLGGKGGEVAMEELHLVAEQIDFEPVG